MSLEGKIAIVTGGSRGIGEGICLELARRGAKIAFTYVSPSSASKSEQVIKKIEAIHKERGNTKDEPVAIAIQADGASMDSPKTIVDGTLKGFNTETIDLLVNNAGVSGDQFLQEITPERYEHVMNVNVRGVIFLTQKVVPHIARGGRIVNLSSVSSRAGLFGQTVYAASKAAIEGLTKVWATELGRKHGITVNAINPGPVDTDMYHGVSPEFDKATYEKMPPTAENRMGTAQDIADIVAFLCEEKSRWVCGDIVSANGGGLFP